MNSKELTARIEAYFAACDATRERLPLKNGGFEERQIPYTLYGLAAATGYAPRTLVEMAQGRGVRAKVIAGAIARVGKYTLERALLGEVTYQVAMSALSMLEGAAEQPQQGRIEIRMDEACERWSR